MYTYIYLSQVKKVVEILTSVRVKDTKLDLEERTSDIHMLWEIFRIIWFSHSQNLKKCK